MRQTVLLCGVAGALTATSALAQQPSMPELSWEAPAGCPQLAEVRARIDAIAGTSVRRETHLQAQARITKEEGRFHLRLVVRDAELTGERNISSDSCEDLAGATAVALGLMLRSDVPLSASALNGVDPSRAAGNTQPPASTQPAPASNDAEKDARQGEAKQVSAQPHWRAFVHAPVFVAELGVLPEPSVGLGLGAGVGYGQWRFWLTGQLWLNQTVHGTDLPAYGAQVGHQSAWLDAGRAFALGRLQLAPYLTLALERISARGVGIDVLPSEQHALWLGVGAGVQGSLELAKPIAIFATLGGRVETSRPLIAIDGLGNVRQLGPLALGSALGLEWTF